MPGLLTDAIDIEELLDELLCFNPDTIWLEAVNPRGSGLKDTETAFRQAGHTKIADAVMEIRDEKNHDDYVAEFVRTANKVGKKLRCDSKFKFLVYNDLESQLKAFTNVIYLGKPKTPKQAPPATTGLPVPQSTQTAKTTPLAIPDREFEYLDIDLITVDPEVAERSNKKKMDDAFAESIKAHGVLQPILVKKTEEGVILVAGAKRFTTAKSIGLETIPVAYLEDESAPEVSLMENLLRQGLGPIDKAETLHKLNKEGKHQQKSLAAMLGMSPNAVSELIGIGGLPKDIRDICRKEPHLYPIRELKTLVTLTDDAAKRAAFKTLGAKAKAKSNKQPVTFEVRVTTKLVDLVADLKKFKDRRPDAEVFAVMKSGLVSLRNELDEVLALARQEAESAQDDIDASNWSEDAPCMPEYTSATSIVNHETLPLLAIKSEVTPAVKPLAERSLADFIPDFGLEDMEQDGAISERDKGGTAVIDGDEEVQEDKDDSDGEQEVEECSIPVWGDNDDDDLSPEDQALYDALLKDDSFIDH
jgi:ParB/RepB/Spo0J family partition protein